MSQARATVGVLKPSKAGRSVKCEGCQGGCTGRTVIDTLAILWRYRYTMISGVCSHDARYTGVRFTIRSGGGGCSGESGGESGAMGQGLWGTVSKRRATGGEW